MYALIAVRLSICMHSLNTVCIRLGGMLQSITIIVYLFHIMISYRFIQYMEFIGALYCLVP